MIRKSQHRARAAPINPGSAAAAAAFSPARRQQAAKAMPLRALAAPAWLPAQPAGPAVATALSRPRSAAARI
jgi:hypothetical protein